MREVPQCLSRRYKALDDLIKELTSNGDCAGCKTNLNEPGVKLMCQFWDILKEDPDCNLAQAVENRMCGRDTNGMFRPQRFTCYMAGCARNDDKSNNGGKMKPCCHAAPAVDSKSKCCASKSVSPSSTHDTLPLSKVLCNLKEAASFEKKCNVRVNELMQTEKELQNQIQLLEDREKDGVQLLKQADCMWSCMEDAYKKKVAESSERQKVLLKQLKEVETSMIKWRKNKKDLEFQLDNIGKCQQEITDKINQKQNDIKFMDMEIADFKKRIENNKIEVEVAKKSLGSKKQASDSKIANISNYVSRLEKIVKEEQRHKNEKEQEGNTYIKEARDDLQKLCRVLLQKKLENEDLKAEREALLLELDLLKQSCEQCRDKCRNKQQTIEDEIKFIDNEIANFKVKCIRCHECTDTADGRKFCTDCPRCIAERDCLIAGDHCDPDHTMDCVCMSVKQQFLDNVFDNMYTVLERQTKSNAGQAVADAILDCLKKSRNGKLNEETRNILQDFILTTVKKNLNLTIVGGAVKTRCEMEPETYKQLMLCLKQVKATRPPKVDKETAAKKEPCPRWGGPGECNCPKGPKSCICTKRAPPPPNDPSPCPPLPPNMEDAGEVVACPHRDSTACGPDCAMHTVPDIAAWRPDPCQGPSCTFKNMRAAQCVLGPESLSALPKSKGYISNTPYVPMIPKDEITCKCEMKNKPCTCHKDIPCRDRIIEEVMGRYTEVTPIEKVMKMRHDQPNVGRKISIGCESMKLIKHCVVNTSENKSSLHSGYNLKIGLVDNVPKYSSDIEMFPKNKGCECTEFSKQQKQSNDIMTTAHNGSQDNSNQKIFSISEMSASSTDEFSQTLLKSDPIKCRINNIVSDPKKSQLVTKKINHSIEWIEVESLIKDVKTLTRICDSDDSNVTSQEVEIKNETLINTTEDEVPKLLGRNNFNQVDDIYMNNTFKQCDLKQNSSGLSILNRKSYESVTKKKKIKLKPKKYNSNSTNKNLYMATRELKYKNPSNNMFEQLKQISNQARSQRLNF